MAENNYIYIELLRQVCPYDKPFYDFDFFLLGSFDAMSIDQGKDIDELKKMYESRHSTVLSVFDRQPIYLYSDGPVDLKADDCIFSTKGKYSAKPLILTLFQMDKLALADNTFKRPEDLIERFSEILKNWIADPSHRIDPSHVEFKVFWNLGESDIVVVFRTDRLYEIADLLHDMRINGLSEETLYIISTSSHCAFPKPAGAGSSDASRLRKTITRRLNQWLKSLNSGKSSDPKTYDSSDFVTLGNVAAIDHPEFTDTEMFSFLFGEWDYMMRFEDMDSLVNHLCDTFMSLITDQKKVSSYAPFRVSYTIPMFRLPEKTEPTQSSTEERKDSPEEPRIGFLDDLSGSMKKLEKEISKQFSSTRAEALINELESLRNTLYGIGKFLYRLRIGRFEEDLYSYIQPVFVRLKEITEDYIRNIHYYCRHDNKLEADTLVIEYLADTSRLVGNMQHLFTIMAVSPHTYMETYGSNMRSLAAADKLLDSYQGIVKYLKDAFPDTIMKSGSTVQQCSREILIFPYRKTHSRHTLLYTGSRPDSRISYISLDFSKMFNLQATIFMLLHECGHHLGDRMRKERFRLFYSAYVCSVICWAGVEQYIQNPIGHLVRRVSIELINTDPGKYADQLFKGLNPAIRKDLETSFNKTIREAMRDGIGSIGGSRGTDPALYINYENFYKAHNDAPYKKDLWKNYYSEQILSYLYAEAIPQYFGVDQNEKNAELTKLLRKSLRDDLTTVFAEPLRDIADQLADEIISKKGNIREALRVKTMYADTAVTVSDFITPVREYIDSKWADGTVRSILSVFSNIYSDLFAIAILGLDYDSYIEIIPKIIGIERLDIMGYKPNLLRVYAISDAVYGHPEVPAFVSTMSPVISDDIAGMWELFQYEPYIPALKEYAGISKSTLDDMILKQKHSDPESFIKLRRMFDGGDDQIEGIYHFYQYLMKKGS